MTKKNLSNIYKKLKNIMVDFQSLLDKYQIKANLNMLFDMWNERHRHFHNIEHLNDIIDQIYNDSKIEEKQKELLYLTALFHDIVYEPTRDDNEEESAEFFLNLCEDKTNPDILSIREAILDTKKHESKTPLDELFNKFDMNIIERDIDSLMKWEHGISQEYKSYGDAYKKGRLNFLESLLDKYTQNTDNLLKLIDFVKNNY